MDADQDDGESMFYSTIWMIKDGYYDNDDWKLI